jgi:tripeptidyl-peptidase-1
MKLIALTIAAIAASVASAGTHQVYKRTTAPPGYARGRRAHQDTLVTATFALKQRNLDRLDALFWEVSDPDSHEYGNFKSIDDINNLIAPAPEARDAVFDFLQQHRVSNIVDNVDSVIFQAPVSTIEAMFETEMHEWRHDNGRMLVRQFGDYFMPDAVFPHVDFVTGLSDFPMPRRKGVQPGKDMGGAQMGSVVPSTLTSMYSIPEGTKASTKSSQNVVEYQDDASFSHTDLSSFYQQTSVKTDQPTVAHIVGPYAPQFPDTEATLDIQYISAVGVDAENWYWTEPQWLFDWATKFFNTEKVPLVNSHSWGWAESQQCTIATDCSTLGIDSDQYVTRVNTEYKKIGLRGVSMLVASGDSGANGRSDYTCTEKHVNPGFPAASPFVTAVGATEVVPSTQKTGGNAPICGSNPCIVSGEERAVSFSESSFASGGGFSNVADMPEYQKEAVSAFLAGDNANFPPASYFNAKGRAYPDVAALGNNYLIEVSGQLSPVGGTSCSSPAFSGIVALLNSYRLEAGLKPLGFLNPLIYKMAKEAPEAFHDITEGNNKCTEMGCASTCEGFTATKGWDPVSGVGTPNFEKMLAYLKKLDARNASRATTVSLIADESERGERVREVFVSAPLGTPHYEDPNISGSCQAGEVDVQIQGIGGKMCAPKCSASGSCPTDVPQGVTAKPTCALQGMGGKYCALVCSPSSSEKTLRAGDAQCGTNASCKAISGVGICTYDK